MILISLKCTCGRRAALNPGMKLGEFINITAAWACATVPNVTYANFRPGKFLSGLSFIESIEPQ